MNMNSSKIARYFCVIGIAFGALLSLVPAAQGQTSKTNDEIAIDRDRLSTENAAVLENSDGQVRSFVAKNSNQFEFTKDKGGRLLGMKKIGGLEIKFRYRSADSLDPTEVKIGHRRWVDVSNARKNAKCSPLTVELPSGSLTNTLQPTTDERVFASPNDPSVSFSGKKIGPMEDDYVTQQELDDMNAMIDALFWQNWNSYAWEELNSSARQRCIDRCNDALTALSLLCLGVGFFGTPVAGGACELTVGVHWAACRIGCSTIP